MKDQVKKGACVDCGNCYPPYVMDLDHVRGKKKANVGTMVGHGIALAHIQAEVAKCDLVCSNCHRIRTHKRGQYRSQSLRVGK